MRQAGTTAAIGSFPFATRLLPLPRSAPSPILEKKKKEKKGFCYPVFLRRSGRLLTWRAGLSERPAPRLCPRPPAVPVQPPSRSSRRPRSGACARWASPARSHFRRSGGSAVPGRCSARRPAVGAGDAGRRSREAPEAGLCRLPRERQVGGRGPETGAGLYFPRWPRCAPKAAPTGLPRTQAGGAVPGCLICPLCFQVHSMWKKSGGATEWKQSKVGSGCVTGLWCPPASLFGARESLVICLHTGLVSSSSTLCSLLVGSKVK